MSALEQIIKNSEEIAIQEEIEEEVIEEVIDEDDWMAPVLEQEYYQQELLDHEQIVDYDYQSFLPIRNGDALYTLNLPDLISRNHHITQESGVIVKVTSCFNKKCQKQIACNGFLYTIKEYVSENQWNNWRCINDQCFGEIRTTPDFTDIRECHGHVPDCVPDELQIVLRIAIYDTRLMAEFTETPLESLHFATVEKLKIDFPEAEAQFPSFEVMKDTLDDHRRNKIYRKRSEMQKFRDKTKKMNMTPDEVLYTENSSGLVRFRRTKPFPPSLCNECDDQIMSTSLPSQDLLIAHYIFQHQKRMTIERFEFKDINVFDHYIRELNTNSRYKVKKMGIADENMYYLCAHDDRLSKCGVGRASRGQSQNCHCTAFIRIFDWRIVSKREGSRIVIDYCIEHQPHPYEPESNYRHIRPISVGGQFQRAHIEYIDYYTPEVFLRDIEERRLRSQRGMVVGAEPPVTSSSSSPSKRPMEAKTYFPPGRMKASFGVRAMAPPLAAQIAAGNPQPYVDGYGETQSDRQQTKYHRQPIRSYQKGDEVTSSPPPQVVINSDRGRGEEEEEDVTQPPPRIYVTHKQYTRITERQNFKDIYTFNAVYKAEDACIALLNRLQSCQHARIGLAYREKITAILRNANTDPGLTDGSTIEEIDQSWVLQRGLRGRPRKRVRTDEEEMDDDDMVAEMEELMEEITEDTSNKRGSGRREEQEEEKQMEMEEEEEEDVKNIPIVHQTQSETASEQPEETTTPQQQQLEEGERESIPSSSSADIMTRSGRQRKPPARLLGE